MTPGRLALCRELVLELVAEYLDGALDPEAAAGLERHLQDCPPCLAYLNTYRATREVTRRALLAEMPPEMAARLRAFLAERLDPTRRDPTGGPGPDGPAAPDRGDPVRTG